MASLKELLIEEGFQRGSPNANMLISTRRKATKFRDTDRDRDRDRDRKRDDSSVTLPICICHDQRRRVFDNSKHKAVQAHAHGSSYSSSSQLLSQSKPSVSSNSGMSRKGEKENISVVLDPNPKTSSGEPAIDEVAIRAVVSILSGYIGRYLKDPSFREAIRQKCYSCLARTRRDDSDVDVDDDDSDKRMLLANLELGIESVEKLVESPGTKKEVRMKSLRNSIRLLNIVASLNSKSSRNDSTCRTPNSYLSACAQLYLSIVYKLEKNDRMCARHLLQVFCDSPSFARTLLLSELWDHFFLPHLLHLKIWYNQESEFLTGCNSDYYFDKENKLKWLSKVYNDHLDIGTIQFALYYKEWLKVGSQPSPVPPPVPLPSIPRTTTYASSRRRLSESSFTTHSSMNKSLYQTVFGPARLESRSMDFDGCNQSLIDTWDLEKVKEIVGTLNDGLEKQNDWAQHSTSRRRRSFSQSYPDHKAESSWPDKQKSEYFRFLTCRGEPAECLVRADQNGSSNISSIRKDDDLSRAVAAICSLNDLRECELAIRVITKTWLDLHGNGDADLSIKTTLSSAAVIEGMLEILFASNDDEILELTISLLAEFVTRNETNRHIILNSDPQLDIFVRTLRSSTLFLKAAVLLYLVKPMAKQMMSVEWVPLVLRVLEYGDQLQTLFSIQCSPHEAAYYFLDQLLTGFDEDKNLENARQVVSIGGLSLLAKRFEAGDVCEKAKAASIILSCIQAEGNCRHYLANNLNKGSILEMLVQRKQRNSQCLAFALLTELLCLNRRTQVTKFLNGLLSGWSNLNTMHILYIYLQNAPVEERPVVAAILLQLDLLGDPLKCSVYREEAIEAIIAALDCEICNEKIQEQSARALSLLGGCFSYKGQATAEKWLLKEAGFHENLGDSFQGKDIVIANLKHSKEEDEEAMQNWQRKLTLVLLTGGKKKFLEALCDSMVNGFPCLAQASLVTVSWMSIYLHSLGDENLQSTACSIFIPHLAESLNYDKALEERVLASFTLLTLTKSSDRLSKTLTEDKGLMEHLHILSEVTWTANELISITTRSMRSMPVTIGQPVRLEEVWTGQA